MSGQAHPPHPWLRVVRVLALLALLVATGCVDRRFIIESNVPNAQVYIDNQLVGAAPAYAAFEYYGKYNITIIQPGFETFTEDVNVTSPWYGYPPLDFLTEVVWPFHIRDTRRYYFKLHEITKPRVDDLLNNANSLRERGYNLPVPAVPAPPKMPPQSQVRPQPGSVLPPAGTQQNPVGVPVGPQPGPIVPPVGPQTGPIVPPVGPQTGPIAPPPIVPPVAPDTGSTVPSVFPR